MTATKASGRQRAGARLRRVSLVSATAANETRSAKSALEIAPESPAAALPDDWAGPCGAGSAPTAAVLFPAEAAGGTVVYQPVVRAKPPDATAGDALDTLPGDALDTIAEPGVPGSGAAGAPGARAPGASRGAGRAEASVGW